MNSIVLSAGFGTRLKPYTDKCAKPAIPFLGIPILGYSLYYLNKANIKNVVINTHHLPETVKKAVNKLAPFLDLQIQFSNEQPLILDSGGGIKQGYQHFDNSDPIVVLNGDSLILLENSEFLKTLLKYHISNQNEVTLVTRSDLQAGTNYRAIWVDTDDNITDIAKKESSTETPLQFVGIMVLSSDFVQKIPFGKSHIFDDCLIPKLGHTKARSFKYENLEFFETGNEKDFLNAQQICRKKLKTKNLSSYWKTLKEILTFYQVDIEKIVHSKNSIGQTTSLFKYHR